MYGISLDNTMPSFNEMIGEFLNSESLDRILAMDLESFNFECSYEDNIIKNIVFEICTKNINNTKYNINEYFFITSIDIYVDLSFIRRNKIGYYSTIIWNNIIVNLHVISNIYRLNFFDTINMNINVSYELKNDVLSGNMHYDSNNSLLLLNTLLENNNKLKDFVLYIDADTESFGYDIYYNDFISFIYQRQEDFGLDILEIHFNLINYNFDFSKIYQRYIENLEKLFFTYRYTNDKTWPRAVIFFDYISKSDLNKLNSDDLFNLSNLLLFVNCYINNKKYTSFDELKSYLISIGNESAENYE